MDATQSEPSRIAVLPAEVINQIAAGEVVERPSSVVKELLENAIDAGARRIDVEISKGGQQLIRVSDDGCGMTQAELELCLLRHATSKLRTAEDLWSLGTMGFRGEALPSIAAVSTLTLTSRPADAALGARVRVDAGARGPLEPVGVRVGTTVEVGELFANTPARRKFLKSTATETARVGELVQWVALAHPEVHITLTVDGRKSLDLPAATSLLERARAVFARRSLQLYRAAGSVGGVAVEACLTPPEQATRALRSVHVLVNRRPVNDRGLAYSVAAGYGDLLEHGRYPVAVLHITLGAKNVDINVHPQKLEVRFSDSQQVFAAVRRTVREWLAVGAWQHERAAANTKVYHLVTQREPPRELVERLREASRRFFPGRAGELAAPPTIRPASTVPAQLSVAVQRESSPAEAQAEAASTAGTLGSLRVVGQALGCYLVLEGEGELWLVDQHAAHERVTFERLRSQVSATGRLPRQGLLLPAPMHLEPRHVAAIAEHGDELERLGFELEPWGGDEHLLRAVPALLASADAGALLRDVLEELGNYGHSETLTQAQDALLARMACHGSVRAGRRLTPLEIAELLRALDSVDFAANCPHGRPVAVRFDQREVAQWFKRR